MEDAEGSRSDDVSANLSQGKNSYTLTVTADPDFLENAAYPVIIDPTTMVTGTSSTVDTCVDEQYPTSNYHSSENLWTGGKTGTNRMRTFIKFTMPSGISASNVTSSHLRIKRREHQVPTIQAYRVTNAWTASAITWNNAPGFDSAGYSSNTAQADGGAWYAMNVTTFVKNWLNGYRTNYGFCLKEPSETNSSQKTKFYSSNAPSPNKPELVIDHTGGTYRTVTYNGNGHTSGTVPSSQSVIGGAQFTLRSNTGNLKKTGYTFEGWCTNATGTGTTYSEGQVITMPTSNLTLYAKWREAYDLTVEHYYDEGYDIRYSNASGQIITYNTIVANEYRELFNLHIDNNVNPIYESLADTCKIQTYNSVDSSNIWDLECHHEDEVESHLIRANVRTQLVSDKGVGTNVLTRVLWTGHIMDGNAISASHFDTHSVIITPCSMITQDGDNYIPRVQEKIDRNSKYELFHELGHQIGLKDHYCKNTNNRNIERSSDGCSNQYCYECYGANWPGMEKDAMHSNITIENPEEGFVLLCEFCQDMAMEHLENHH